MYSCLRHSCCLPKKVFISNRNSFLKFFSALSSSHDTLKNNYDSNNLFSSKINKAIQIQQRCFSFENVRSAFEFIRTSEVSKLVTSTFIQFHDFTGLSWTSTIIASSLALKLITFPCGIYQHYLTSKLELTKLELVEEAKILREVILVKGAKRQWSEQKFKSELYKEVKNLHKRLIIKNNCHPFKIIILFFIQLPFWLLLTITLKTLAMDYYLPKMENPVAALQLVVGGPFWCKNLTIPDPTYTLPTINLLSSLVIFEFGAASRIQSEISQQKKSVLFTKVLPNLQRLFAGVFFLISASSPSAVSLFWTSSSLLSLSQNFLLMSPKVRRFFKIPKTASECEKPYKHAFDNFTKKVEKFLIWRK